jgi:hypothetical protein
MSGTAALHRPPQLLSQVASAAMGVQAFSGRFAQIRLQLGHVKAFLHRGQPGWTWPVYGLGNFRFHIA